MELFIGLFILWLIYIAFLAAQKISLFLIELTAEILVAVAKGLHIFFNDILAPALSLIFLSLCALAASPFCLGWVLARFTGRVLIAPLDLGMLGKLQREADQEFCLAVGLEPAFLEAHDIHGEPRTAAKPNENISQVSDIFSLIFAIMVFSAIPIWLGTIASKENSALNQIEEALSELGKEEHHGATKNPYLLTTVKEGPEEEPSKPSDTRASEGPEEAEPTLDEEAWAKARAFFANPSRRMCSEMRSRLSQALNVAGPEEESLIQAIVLFQARNNLDADGRPGKETITALFGEDTREETCPTFASLRLEGLYRGPVVLKSLDFEKNFQDTIIIDEIVPGIRILQLQNEHKEARYYPLVMLPNETHTLVIAENGRIRRHGYSGRHLDQSEYSYLLKFSGENEEPEESESEPGNLDALEEESRVLEDDFDSSFRYLSADKKGSFRITRVKGMGSCEHLRFEAIYFEKTWQRRWFLTGSTECGEQAGVNLDKLRKSNRLIRSAGYVRAGHRIDGESVQLSEDSLSITIHEESYWPEFTPRRKNQVRCCSERAFREAVYFPSASTVLLAAEQSLLESPPSPRCQKTCGNFVRRDYLAIKLPTEKKPEADDALPTP